jgi:teichuronic acid biosynthesis glycosyltransferase TuaH
LLPYRRNAWTQHIHPLKLYEYLAAGLPVVSADIPSVHDEADIVQIAPDAAGFIQAVHRALQETVPEARMQRQARAARNTWRARVERISDLILQAQAAR